jgi:hypothetical protein
MRKLSNDELATRTREANRRRGERARERLTIAGRAALTVWLPVWLRSQFVNEAAGSGMTINELATKLIEKGMLDSKLVNFNSPQMRDSVQFVTVESEIADPDTADLFATPEPEPQTPVVVADTASTHNTVSVGSDRDTMMVMVNRLLADGLTGADIARKLTAAGYKSQQGTELRGANVLREYRVWKEKSSGSESTAV